LNKNKDNIILWDQYGLNIILAGLWIELEKKWNTITHNLTEEMVFRHFAFTKPDSLKADSTF
jgi:lipopolysaccharide biosynthesis glycosyltransferase